jgi:hypothetical protein
MSLGPVADSPPSPARALSTGRRSTIYAAMVPFAYRSMATIDPARKISTHHVCSHNPMPIVSSAMPTYIGLRVRR